MPTTYIDRADFFLVLCLDSLVDVLSPRSRPSLLFFPLFSRAQMEMRADIATNFLPK